MNIKIDNTSIFSESFDIFDYGDQSYVAPSGGQLVSHTELGFSHYWNDDAYDMGLDSAFDSILHTSDTLTIEWFASGAGWQGGNDESWAIEMDMTLPGSGLDI